MVFYIQIDKGPLIPVKGIGKAKARATFLLRKAPPGAVPYLITGKDRSEVGGGWGAKRRLKL